MIKKKIAGRAPLVHACNPSYSGGRDQEDHGQKPAQADSSRDPILKNPSQKYRSGGVVQGEGPEFKPQYRKKKKKKKKKLPAELCSGVVPHVLCKLGSIPSIKKYNM
jgi:hypothetical protein